MQNDCLQVLGKIQNEKEEKSKDKYAKLPYNLKGIYMNYNNINISWAYR